MSCDLIKILVKYHKKRLWYVSINFFLNTDDVILKLYISLCQKAKCTLFVWSTVMFLCQHLGVAPEEGAYSRDKMSDPAYKPFD